MSFAQALDNLNQSVISRLWDTQVDFGGGRMVNAIFEQDYAVESLGAMGMSTSRPAITVLSSEVVDLAHRSKVTLRGKEYTVIEVQPDGQGLTTLLMEL